MEKQYRIKIISPDSNYDGPISSDPKRTGDSYRANRKSLNPGQEIVLQEREIGPWKVIESEKKE